MACRLWKQNLDHPHNETLYCVVEGGVVALFAGHLTLWLWSLPLCGRQRQRAGVVGLGAAYFIAYPDRVPALPLAASLGGIDACVLVCR